MDPLSLTVSIITLASLGSPCSQLFKTIASLRNGSRLALTLAEELSHLRRDVFVVHELFTRHSKGLMSSSDPVALDHDMSACVVNCLEQAEALIIELDRSHSRLLMLLSYSDIVAPRKWVGWMREEKRLKHLKKGMFDVRSRLNIALGVLDLDTSMRLQTVAQSLSNHLAKFQEDQAKSEQSNEKHRVRQEALMEPTTQYFSTHEQKPIEDSSLRCKDEVMTMATKTSYTPKLARKCDCCCHHRYSKRSSRVLDQVFGTLFAGYSGVSSLIPRCNVLGCKQSCASSDIMLSLNYLFPLWLLSWGFTLAFKTTIGGFDHSFRLFHCVEYSSPIFRYAYEGDVARMKALLKARLGSPFDVTSEPQRSLLGVAASRGHGEICNILLHEGADPFYVDYRNRSAVEIAWEAVLTNSKAAKNLKMLVAFSSSENYVSDSNLSRLHRSVLGISRFEIKPLLENMPYHAIDEKDVEGQTPLYWAARRGDVQAVSLLLGAGADSNSKNNRGTSILTAAIMSSNTECIWKILESGCNVNCQQKDGYTPLHHCCRYDVHISIIKVLLNRGADRNAKTVLGHTPLMIATFNVHTAAAMFLIEYHIDLDIQGKDEACALHHAAMSGDHEVVRHLLQHGADPLLKTANGETLLHFIAQRNGDYETLRSVEPFDLRGINVEDVTRKQKLSALQIAEKHHGGDADWLRLFKSLIEKVRLESSSVIPESVGYADALEYFD